MTTSVPHLAPGALHATHLFARMRDGDRAAEGRLTELIHGEIRVVAARKRSKGPEGLALKPSALVHEAWLRLGGDSRTGWINRRHFLVAAGEAMRRILVERSRRKVSPCHSECTDRVDFDEISLPLAASIDDEQLLNLDAALERLAAKDPEKAQLVKLRYFVGLTLEEAASALNISESTARRWWAYSRAWLYEACRKE